MFSCQDMKLSSIPNIAVDVSFQGSQTRSQEKSTKYDDLPLILAWERMCMAILNSQIARWCGTIIYQAFLNFQNYDVQMLVLFLLAILCKIFRFVYLPSKKEAFFNQCNLHINVTTDPNQYKLFYLSFTRYYRNTERLVRNPMLHNDFDHKSASPPPPQIQRHQSTQTIDQCDLGKRIIASGLRGFQGMTISKDKF